MSDYISKDALRLIKTKECAGHTIDYAIGWKACVDYLKALPSADVAPVVHSQWKYKCGEIQCPECGNRIHRIDLSGCLNFCPNCGAKMDGERKE